jgi:hypothetical protein
MARYPSRGFGDPPLAVTAAWHRVMWEVLAMRISALWGGIIAILLPATAFFVAALPDPSFAQQESPFFLQGHGGVRVLRGTSEGVNFEAATIAPEDEEVSEGEQQAAVQPTAPVVEGIGQQDADASHGLVRQEEHSRDSRRTTDPDGQSLRRVFQLISCGVAREQEG